jgi:hypothetical protein
MFDRAVSRYVSSQTLTSFSKFWILARRSTFLCRKLNYTAFITHETFHHLCGSRTGVSHCIILTWRETHTLTILTILFVEHDFLDFFGSVFTRKLPSFHVLKQRGHILLFWMILSSELSSRHFVLSDKKIRTFRFRWRAPDNLESASGIQLTAVHFGYIEPLVYCKDVLINRFVISRDEF